MKSCLALLSVMLAAGTCAGADVDLPHVSVFGTAVTEIQPDLLRWRLSIETRGSEVAPVADEHAADVAGALAFLKAQGILPAETQTSRMHLDERREYKRSSWVQEGYEASTELAFTSKDLARYRSLWEGLSKLKGITIRTAVWDSSRRIEVQNATRLEALKAAKDKAAAMASVLDVRIAEPLAIVEVPMSEYDAQRNRTQNNLVGAELGVGDSAPDAVAPGSIEIRVRVQVSFRIITI